MNEVGSLIGKPKESRTWTPDDKWVLPKTLIGLEFEYEGAKRVDEFMARPEIQVAWTHHREDSLKDNGAEFVFSNPMFGTDAYNSIVHLMTQAKAHGFKCTIRGGIHVHIDVRDLETPQLIGFIILYTIVEPLLFRWIGDNRDNFIFCIPFYKSDGALLGACRLVRAITQDEQNNAKLTVQESKNFGRYAALNLNALQKYGSVEFRHMKTTHDVQRVVDWINMIQSLKAATFKLPTSDGAILRLARATRPNEFLDYVFGAELARKLWVPEAHSLIQRVGIPTARDLVLYGLTAAEWREPRIPDGKHEGFTKFYEALKKSDVPENSTLTKSTGTPRGFVRVNRPNRYANVVTPNVAEVAVNPEGEPAPVMIDELEAPRAPRTPEQIEQDRRVMENMLRAWQIADQHRAVQLQAQARQGQQVNAVPPQPGEARAAAWDRFLEP